MNISSANPMVLIDNYDSFTYNLADQLLRVSGSTYENLLVFRNDECMATDIWSLNPACIVFSPGPGTPEESGLTIDLLGSPHMQTIPALGVCLGHQAMVVACGGVVGKAIRPLHGKISQLSLTNSPLFRGLKTTLNVGRYHSLIANPKHLPPELKALAYSEDNEIMAIQHTCYPWVGVQFHPESFLTQDGDTIIKNFFCMTGVLNIQERMRVNSNLNCRE